MKKKLITTNDNMNSIYMGLYNIVLYKYYPIKIPVLTFYTFWVELYKVWRKSLKVRERTLREGTWPCCFSQNASRCTCFLHWGRCHDKQMNTVLSDMVGLHGEGGASSCNSLQTRNKQLTDWVWGSHFEDHSFRDYHKSSIIVI